MTNNNRGVRIFLLIFILFFVLKLAGIGMIGEWGWWWVCAPLWLPITAMVGMMVLLTVLKIIADSVLGKKTKR
jgi:hypothetical protein